MAVIEAEDLHRTYRTSTGIIRRRRIDVEAVRGVTFAIEEGELFGLLGPNGGCSFSETDLNETWSRIGRLQRLRRKHGAHSLHPPVSEKGTEILDENGLKLRFML